MKKKEYDDQQDIKINNMEQKIEALKKELQQKKDKTAFNKPPSIETINSDRISLWFLLSRLKIVQLWGLLALIASLISGAATLSYQFANKKSDVQLLQENTKYEISLAEQKMKIKKLTEQTDDLLNKEKLYNTLKEKEKFVCEFLRYEQSKYACASQEWNDACYECKIYDKTKKSFIKIIKKLLEKKESDNIEGIIVSQGEDVNFARVKFLYDGTVWTIPSEIYNASINDDD